MLLASHKLGALLPVGAIDPNNLVTFPLSKINKAAVDKDGHHNEDEEEAQLFIRLKFTS